MLLPSSSLILLDESYDGAPGQVLVLLPIALNLQIPEQLKNLAKASTLWHKQTL